MGGMTFETGTNRSGTMEKIAFGKALMAVCAEYIGCYDKAGVGTFVMAVVTFFISKRWM
jgi:hypothetical protein